MERQDLQALYDKRELSLHVYNQASRILSEVFAALPRLSYPTLVMRPNGRVRLQWVKENNSFHIDIFDSGRMEFYRSGVGKRWSLASPVPVPLTQDIIHQMTEVI